jgi:hypothetical protein
MKLIYFLWFPDSSVAAVDLKAPKDEKGEFCIGIQ